MSLQKLRCLVDGAEVALQVELAGLMRQAKMVNSKDIKRSSKDASQKRRLSGNWCAGVSGTGNRALCPNSWTNSQACLATEASTAAATLHRKAPPSRGVGLPRV